MPMNAALEGKTYPALSFDVLEERVRRFAAALGQEGSFVPPTFVTVPAIEAGLAKAVADPELGLDFSRVVHGEEEHEWSRPIRAGETLEAAATIESIRSKGGHEFLTIRTDLRDPDGVLVATARSSLVVRGSA